MSRTRGEKGAFEMKARQWWILGYKFLSTLGGHKKFEAFDYQLSSPDAIQVIVSQAA